MRKLIYTAVIAALVLGAGQAAAGIGEDMESFFGDMNYQNITRPGVYEGQSAGYYTGGGIYARVPIRNYSLLNVQMPRFRAGCGGIDLFTGGFSHINADQFVEMLRSIGQNAKSLAFMLALQVVSPQISGKLSELQELAEKWNLGSLNSCEAAGKALGGALGFFGATEQECIVREVSSSGEDYETARQKCRENVSRNNTDTTAPQLVTKGNLAWQAMMKNELFRNDLDLAQVVMNLSGTVIITDDGGSNPQYQFRRVPSILDGADATQVLTALLYGDTVEIFKCSDPDAAGDKCTTVSDTRSAITISTARALEPKVRSLLISLQTKILDDTAASAEEKGLLAATSLPVYKFITVAAAYQPVVSSPETTVGTYSTLIATDIVFSYILDLLKKVKDAASRLPDSQAGEVKQFLDDVATVRRQISERKTVLSQDYNQALEFTRNAQLYERMLIGRLSPEVLQSAMWSTGR